MCCGALVGGLKARIICRLQQQLFLKHSCRDLSSCGGLLEDSLGPVGHGGEQSLFVLRMVVICGV
jgi:hypothetical protein